MDKEYRILAINPGSTSTKIAVYKNLERVFESEVFHEAAEAEAKGLSIDDIGFRREQILRLLHDNGIDLSTLQAVVGRGGFVKPISGGIYTINQAMIDDVTLRAAQQHASNLGIPLAAEIGQKYSIPAFTVDPVVVDELEDIARVSGFPGIERKSVLHALNIRAVARITAEQLGKSYNELNMIVVHMGGGISVTAHKKGRMVDVNNALLGMGPFSPQRAGALPIGDLIEFAFKSYQEGKTVNDLKKLLAKKAGLMGYLGTNDAREVEKNIAAGDKKAALIFEAMVYTIAKEIGSMATVLHGKVDAIVLTGGLSFSPAVVDWIKERCEWIAPVRIVKGQEEMSTMARNAYEVLSGIQKPKEY